MENDKLTETRREATQKFLVSYKIRKQLGEVTSEDVVTTAVSGNDSVVREECARLVRPFDSDISAGQVRMLSGVERLTYVLVIRKWNADAWLVVPFSMYSSPATDTELQMKVNGGVGLRVLQLWNARSLLIQTLAKSWLVHTLSDDDLADAFTAWQWSVGVGELSEDQLARTGMPITNRKDPRIEYQDVSLANFAKIDAKDLALSELVAAVREANAGRNQPPFIDEPVFEKEEDYDLAAADKSEPVVADCKVDGLNGLVHLRYDPKEKELRLRVFGLDGNRSSALDGWSVFGKDAVFLDNIDGADFVHKFKDRFDGVLSLVDENGVVNPLLSVAT